MKKILLILIAAVTGLAIYHFTSDATAADDLPEPAANNGNGNNGNGDPNNGNNGNANNGNNGNNGNGGGNGGGGPGHNE